MIDEDFVGFLKKIVSASSAGTVAHDVQASVCDKYRHGMSFAVWKRH